MNLYLRPGYNTERVWALESDRPGFRSQLGHLLATWGNLSTFLPVSHVLISPFWPLSLKSNEIKLFFFLQIFILRYVFLGFLRSVRQTKKKTFPFQLWDWEHEQATENFRNFNLITGAIRKCANFASVQ